MTIIKRFSFNFFISDNMCCNFDPQTVLSLFSRKKKGRRGKRKKNKNFSVGDFLKN
jgi:hypothetical protein